MKHKTQKKGSFFRDMMITVIVLGALGGGATFIVTNPDTVESWLGKSGAADQDDGEAERPPKQHGKKPRPDEHGSDRPDPTDPDTKGGPIVAPPQPPPGPKPGPGPKPPAHSATESAALLEKAENQYRAMAYGAALATLGRIPERTLSSADRKKAEQLRARSEAFREITADVDPLELADGHGLVRVEFKNPKRKPQLGRLIKQRGGYITIQMNHGIKGIFPASDVANIKKVSREDALADRTADFRKMAGDISGKTSLELFELAEHCIREGLKEQVTPLLEKGLSKDKLFREMIYNEKAKRVYRLFLWYKAKKKDRYADKTLVELRDRFPHSPFTTKAVEDSRAKPQVAPPRRPDSRPAPKPPEHQPSQPDPQPAPRPDPPEFEPDPEPAPPAPIPPGSDLLNEAKRWYQTAKRFEENAMPGRPGADDNNRKAIDAYHKAIGLYEEAQRKFPAKAEEFEDLIGEMQASLFWCKKRQTLG